MNKLVLGLALSAAACGGKKDDKQREKQEVKTADGKSDTARRAAFAPVPVEFEWTTWTDNRAMKFAIQAPVPEGWKLMTEGDSLRMLQTFMPGDTDPKGAAVWSTSSLTFSATCNGSCMGAEIGANVTKLGKDRVAAQLGGAKLLEDGERSPGVYVFALELDGDRPGEKRYDVGAIHWNAEWDSAVMCEAMLFGADGKRYADFLDACAGAKFEVVDTVVGADRSKQEEANLAKCPASSTLTYTAKEPKPGEPVFDGVQAVHATGTQVGAVSIALSSVALAGDEWRDKPLEPGQGVVEIWLGLATGGPPDILAGTYTLDGSTPLTASVGVRTTGGVTWSISSGGKGGVEVIARTRKKICGKIDVSDEWRSIQGEFVADLNAP